MLRKGISVGGETIIYRKVSFTCLLSQPIFPRNLCLHSPIAQKSCPSFPGPCTDRHSCVDPGASRCTTSPSHTASCRYPLPAWPQFAPEYHPQPARAGKCFHCLFSVHNLSSPVKVCRPCWPHRDRSVAWDGSSCACRGQPCCAAMAPGRLRVASALACRHFALTADVCSCGDGFLCQWHG